MVPGVTRVVGPALAVGRLRASFPSLGLQREYAEAAEADPDAPVASSDLKDLISQDEYRYLARQMCWVFTVQSVDVCVVVPRSEADLDELVESLAADDENTVQVLVGEPATRLPAPGCSDAGLPMVSPVQLLSFTMDQFAGALGQRYDADRVAVGAGEPTVEQARKPERRAATRGQAESSAADEGEGGAEDAGGTGNDPRWGTMVRDVFSRLTRRADSTGFNDEDRARNYLALKDPGVYALTWNAQSSGQNLIGIGTRQFVRGGRRMVAVRFSFRHWQTHVIERYETLVDTHDLFCFKAAPLTPTYD
jgi:hypothetical protein